MANFKLHLYDTIAYMACLLITLLVPQCFKKVIFIASVHIVLFELSPEDKMAFKKINDKFKLVDKPDLLIMPNGLINTLWEKGYVDNLISEAELVKKHELEPDTSGFDLQLEAIAKDYIPALHLASKLVKSTPSWLRYTGLSEQIKDILIPAHERLMAA
jgi:hypothetical protein